MKVLNNAKVSQNAGLAKSDSSKNKAAALSNGNKKTTKNVAKKRKKKQNSNGPKLKPLMPDMSVRTERTPEMMAKILLILYTHSGGKEFYTYNLGISAFMQLSGMAVITDDYLSNIDRRLRPNNFCLIRLKDCFFVTTLAEMLKMQVKNPNVVSRYLPGNCSDTNIELEYTKLSKVWRWSLNGIMSK
jgi:hypothetical protein